jgi:hypothetical protein
MFERTGQLVPFPNTGGEPGGAQEVVWNRSWWTDIPHSTRELLSAAATSVKMWKGALYTNGILGRVVGSIYECFYGLRITRGCFRFCF